MLISVGEAQTLDPEFEALLHAMTTKAKISVLGVVVDPLKLNVKSFLGHSHWLITKS